MKALDYSVLTTDRLILRPPCPSDEAVHYDFQKDPSNLLLMDANVHKDIGETRGYFEKMKQGTRQKKWLFWIIADGNTNRPLGTISVWNINQEKESGELEYGLYPNAKKKGYMTEALKKVMDYCFNHLDMVTLYAWTHKDNIASIRLLENNSFVFIKTVEEKAHSFDGMMTYNVYEKST